MSLSNKTGLIVAVSLSVAIWGSCLSMDSDLKGPASVDSCDKHLAIEQLLCDKPAELLKQCRSLQKMFFTELVVVHQFDQKNKSREEIVKIFDAVRKRYEGQNPIFLLHECGCCQCSFNREINPRYRDVFEQLVSARLIHKIQEKLQDNPQDPRSVEYVAFASGGCFSDARILNLALKSFPQAAINVHLIDKAYALYAKYRDLVLESRQVEVQDSLWSAPSPVVMHKLYEQFVSKDILDLLSPDVLYCYVADEVLLQAAKKNQFVSWLNTRYCQAKVHTFVHDSAQSYQDYSASHSMQSLDILSASDIKNEVVFEVGPFGDANDGEAVQSATGEQSKILDLYKKLVVQSLRKKPLSQNLILCADEACQKVGICSMDLSMCEPGVFTQVCRPLDDQLKTTL